jgi:flagellar basal-body rod protein FlgC
MTSQRTRLNIITMNLANANTTKTPEGTPYRRKTAIFRTVPINNTFEERLQNTLDKKIYGVEVKKIVPVDTEFKKIYDPTHPDADKRAMFLCLM